MDYSQYSSHQQACYFENSVAPNQVYDEQQYVLAASNPWVINIDPQSYRPLTEYTTDNFMLQQQPQRFHLPSPAHSSARYPTPPQAHFYNQKNNNHFEISGPFPFESATDMPSPTSTHERSSICSTGFGHDTDNDWFDNRLYEQQVCEDASFHCSSLPLDYCSPDPWQGSAGHQVQTPRSDHSFVNLNQVEGIPDAEDGQATKSGEYAALERKVQRQDSSKEHEINLKLEQPIADGIDQSLDAISGATTHRKIASNSHTGLYGIAKLKADNDDNDNFDDESDEPSDDNDDDHDDDYTPASRNAQAPVKRRSTRAKRNVKSATTPASVTSSRHCAAAAAASPGLDQVRNGRVTKPGKRPFSSSSSSKPSLTSSHHNQTFPHKCPNCPNGFRTPAELERHAATVHKRVYVCVFAFAGCASTFTNKNEWKRHAASQHIGLSYWRCDVGLCGEANKSKSGPDAADLGSDTNNGSLSAASSRRRATPGRNGGARGGRHRTALGATTTTTATTETAKPSKKTEFNRKDLFTQHLIRMHAPAAVKQKKERDEHWERKMRQWQESCARAGRPPPSLLGCPAPGCERVRFEGVNCWDERMEHIGRHLEGANSAAAAAAAGGRAEETTTATTSTTTMEGGSTGSESGGGGGGVVVRHENDDLLVEWTKKQGIIERDSAGGGWRLCETKRGGRSRSKAGTARTNHQQHQHRQTARVSAVKERISSADEDEDDDENDDDDDEDNDDDDDGLEDADGEEEEM